jgi:hypothetical protein
MSIFILKWWNGGFGGIMEGMKYSDIDEMEQIMETAVPNLVRRLSEILEEPTLSAQGITSAGKLMMELMEKLKGSVGGKNKDEVMVAIQFDPEYFKKVMDLTFHFIEWGCVPGVERGLVENTVRKWFDDGKEEAIDEQKD